MHPHGRGSSFFRIFLLICVVGLRVFDLADAQVLTPPYFNLALGRRILATSTCGELGPELFCKLIGADTDEVLLHHETLIQGQSCGYCNSSNPQDNHGPEFAVDGRETWWQSPPLSRGMLYNEVNLTIELGQEFHVAYVIVTMANSPRPGVWALERSNDNGQTFLPWQYFANTPGECNQYFGDNVSSTITADDSVICTTEFSKIVPLEGGEIVVPLVQNRPSANDFFNSTVLQEWTRATNVRFRLIRIKNLLGHLMGLANQDTTTTRRYFYSIKDISIGGRCRCNGHADTCTSIDQNDPYRLVCDCKDNTCGNNCETCCPGFEQKKWSQSKNNRKFVCEPCNCNRHSERCVYNETVDNMSISMDIHGNYEGGGVCQDCRDNTKGINCDKCANGYYRSYGKAAADLDACSKCQCDYPYYTGNCEDGTGRCECKPEYTKPKCDSCSYGHYGYPMCRPCDCNINGTTSGSCTPNEGICPCQSNFGAPFCRVCAEGYYSYPECKPCECSSIGSTSNVCDVGSGECKCKSNFGGKNCDQCSDGYYSFPACTYCNCDVKGTLLEVCSKSNGQCLCKPGYGGPRCDQCIANFTGFPDCKPCNCSSVGSAFPVCDANGKCSCFVNYGGKQCDQCSPGYYQYPNCTACNCDPEGTHGITCNNDGSCVCKPNFDGEKCNDCKKGFYNYPNCEECTYNPAGVISTFTGCYGTGDGPQPMTIQCKPRVKGKQCNDCREPFWNLQTWNPEGCEDCGCSRNGTLGALASCDTKTGQCFCKPSVTSKQCDQCADGYYKLAGENLFGCTACDCDIGGASSSICDKKTGQCRCYPRVEGRDCKQPLDVHYFPTLHQYQYEIEDGHTPGSNPVRYGFEERLFPDFSWRGYGIFSHLQNETVHDIMIRTPSVYRIILRYVNPNQMAISGTVSVNPELVNNIDAEQKFIVLFKPTTSPSFVTVAGITGNNPSPFVMNPGPWILKIKIEKGLFLDYFVLIPAEYYEGSLLVSDITNPCTIDRSNVCKHYLYPNVSDFDQVRGAGGFINNGDSRSPVQQYFKDYQDALGLPRMPSISNKQTELYLDLRIARPGQYVLVVLYATTKNQNYTMLELEARTQNKSNKTVVPIYNCRYTVLCRQMALDREGVVQIFDFDSNFINLILKGAGDGIGIDSVVAIPVEKWSLGYVQPKPSCLMKDKDKNCAPATYNAPPDSRRIDFKTGNEEHVTKRLPSTISDNSTELIFLDSTESMVDLKGKVLKPGPYVFVVHYYQPDFPDFDMDVLVHNGVTYEAKLPVNHCPSTGGCRSVVKQANGNNVFQLPENFVFSIKASNGKHIWLHYLLAIPSAQYTEQIITEQPFDQTAMFISQCGQNHFYLNTTEEGFCKNATFSLTTKYNHGTIPCACDFEGSFSFECAPFGGQCPCRPNVIGRRCDSCRTGYFGFPNCESCNCPSSAYCDATTGACICPPNVWGEKCNKCRAYTYGWDSMIGCAECNCNVHGVKNNNLQCDLQNGACDCAENIEGRTCDHCSAGNWQFPDCKLCECDMRGTTVEVCDQSNADCYCKPNVQGQACDVCKDGTFNLQPENLEGCTECFCFGKTTRCSSSTLFVSSLSAFDGWKLALINNTGQSIDVTRLATEVEKVSGGVEVNLGYVLDGVSYFVAPGPYLGNKLTTYGGSLNYTLYYTALEDGNSVGGADLILYGANTYLKYESVNAPSVASYFLTSLKIVESNFLTLSEEIVKRAELMQVLQNLTAIYIKATYSSKQQIAKLLTVALEIATPEYNQYSSVALPVEQCHCPPNYVGLSCEECADGYYRLSTGPFGGWCVQCQCNGHASTCDKITGVCHNCKHNTKGDHCEKCEMGYYGNATLGAPNDCLICACPLPVASNNFATGCEINESGDKITCDCMPGYTGDRCEKCAPGYHGRPEVTGEVCVPCNCNGNINPSDPGSCDHVTGRCTRCLNNTYGDSCERCAPGFFGDSVNSKNCQPCACDKCGTHECDHRTGQCTCRDNVVGEKCDRCADNHFGYSSCQGCAPCNCGEASESLQCDDLTGYCRCKGGVTGQTCDKCSSGYWKYTAEGCTSCGCNSEYSRGFGCNVNTGMCECLPGVVGDKCNQCPYRWVLIPDAGCYACDKCIDGLLDVTDALQIEFSPIFNQFQTASIGYFTVQRLKFINETTTKLAPNVSDVLSYQFDLLPYYQNISNIEAEVEALRRNIQMTLDDVVVASRNGSLIFENALDVEKLINQVINTVRNTVSEINNLAYTLEGGTVRQVDYAVNEAKQIEKDIANYVLDEERKTEAEEVLEKAKNLTSSVMEFSMPLLKTAATLESVKLKKDTMDRKFDDLEDFGDKARRVATEASGLNQLQKKAKVSERVDTLANIRADAENALSGLPDVEKNTSVLLDQAKENFKRLAEAKENLTSWESRANQNLTTLMQQLNDARREIKDAEDHAIYLERQAVLLASTAGNQASAEHALKAANAYADIMTAVDAALANITQAKKDVELAVEKSAGLLEKIQSIQSASLAQRDSAHQALNDVQGKLNQELSSVMLQKSQLSKNVNQTAANIENIRKRLKELGGQKSITDQLQKLKPDAVSNESRDILTNMKEVTDNVPKKLEDAKSIFNDRSNKRKTTMEIENFLEGAENKIPEIKNSLDTLRNKSDELNLDNSIKNISDNLESLKQKISRAKDVAAKIKVGVTLSPKTSLELPVPSTLLEQGSSTDVSLYFNTNQSNALLFYLGNEVTARQKRDAMRKPKTDDYMALLLVGGHPILKLDLGERIVLSMAVKVKNGGILPAKWYYARVKRSNKLVNVTIVDSEGQPYWTNGECSGLHSVLNLDKEHSKFFIGGLPAQFEAPSPIEYATFSGKIQDVTVNSEPIGLWNFVNLAKPIDVPGAINGSVERDVLLKTKTSTACRFTGEGFVKLPASNYMTSDSTTVVMNFKTTADDGLLFLTYRDQTFVSIELRSGYVYFQYNVGKGLKSLYSSVRQYNDGEWHTIDVNRVKNAGSLKIDSEQAITDTSASSDIDFEIPEYLFIGGYEGNHKLHDVVKKAFEGCIDNLLIKGEAVDMSSSSNAYRTIPGCSDQFSNFVSFEEGSHGYVRWPRPNLRPRWMTEYNMELSLRIKTKASSAFIAYGSDGVNSFYLQVSNGGILFRSGKHKVDTGPNMKYNDSLWHAITVVHEPNALHLVVDDFEMFKSSEAPSGSRFSTSGTVYFGTVPSEVDVIAAFETPFAGCIGDVTFNGAIVNFEEVWEGREAVIGKCSGRGKNIKSKFAESTKPGTMADPSAVTTPMSLESTTTAAVTVAPGSLPLRPATDPDLSNESGQRFGTTKDSSLRYDFDPSQFGGKLTLSLDMKTIAPEGIVFYVTEPQRKNFVALYMKDSNLYLKYQCDDSAETMSSPMINQAEWHTVKFTISATEAEMTINGNARKSSSVGCSVINLSPPYFVGGVSDPVLLESAKMHLDGVNKTFVGCLRNFKPNGKVAEKPKRIGVIPCSSKVEEGTFFSPDEAYLKLYERFRVGKEMEIKMQIKPRDINGLLIAVHSRIDYLILQMVNGSLKFSVENGNGERWTLFKPSSDFYFVDGEWHSITAYKKKNVILLTVDNKPLPPDVDLGVSITTDTSHPLFIGGYPTTLAKSKGIEGNTQYVGCIRNVEINGRKEQLSSFTPHGNVMFNVCPTI